MATMDPTLGASRMCLGENVEADPHPKPQNDGQKPAQGADAKALCYLPEQQSPGIVGLRRGF